MKRDPTDYSLDDIKKYIGEVHGLTLAQVLDADFPPCDYATRDDLRMYWTWRTVFGWLQSFHTAMHVMERAKRPEDFERFQAMLQHLPSEEGTDDATP